MSINAHWVAATDTAACRLSFDRVSLAIDVAATETMGTRVVPLDFLAAALASCTSLALGSAVKRQRLAVQNLRVYASHTQAGADVVITRAIHVVGLLTDEQMVDLLKVAEECMMHQMLIRHHLERQFRIVTVARLENTPDV